MIAFFGDATYFAPITLPHSWTAVTATFILTTLSPSEDNSGFISLSLGSQNFESGSVNVGSIEFSNTDVVRIGGSIGFLGAISNFKIYSPGSAIMNKSDHLSYYLSDI